MNRLEYELNESTQANLKREAFFSCQTGHLKVLVPTSWHWHWNKFFAKLNNFVQDF